MKKLYQLIVASSFIFLVSVSTFASDTAPAWLKQAAAANVPTYAKDVPAVVLHDEQTVTLNSNGEMVTVSNYAVKIILREGRGFATATALYLTNFNKVRDMDAWVIRPGGSVNTYGKKEIIDTISDPDDVYNEYRVKIIDASRDVDSGYIFGYTVVSEDRPLFYHDTWGFQGRLPTLMSRYTLNLPSGWQATSKTFNVTDVKPSINGSSYTWQLNNLQPIPPEPLSPSIRNIAPRIAVNYLPADRSQSTNKAFTDWTEVSQWASGLYDPQVIIDDAVAAKSRELTAGKTTELEKIRAIANYVQGLQYISIDIGVGHGNGYRPRPSTTVLSRGYGDCKDKANLMRAMLKVINIEAFPIAIYSGDRTFVRAEWASPNQFNHCIIAVKVGKDTEASTIIDYPTLGRLLIFDATDPYTSLGDLPDYLQGSNALIIAGKDGGLAKMPITPPETDLLERNVEVSLNDQGEVKGNIKETANGQTSSYFRQEHRSLSATDYKKAIEGWLTSGATGAQLIKMDTNDLKANSSFGLNVDFIAPRYGQLMQGRLLLFKPVIVGRRNELSLTEKNRNYPVMLESQSMRETSVFTLPSGFIVDEMPDAVNLDTPFGTYTTNYEVKDGKLTFKRSLIMKRTMVEVKDYNAVRDFYAKMRDVEQSPVVLLKN